MFRANQADNLTRGLPSERLGCKLLTLLDMRMGTSTGVRTTAIALLALAWLGFAAPASAQIYSWRDANGHLVLSNQRPDSEVRTYAVPQADSVRATRSVTASRDLMYDDLIVEHARVNGLRTDLVRAVVQVESAFNQYARSPKGAMGLMQ